MGRGVPALSVLLLTSFLSYVWFSQSQRTEGHSKAQRLLITVVRSAEVLLRFLFFCRAQPAPCSIRCRTVEEDTLERAWGRLDARAFKATAPLLLALAKRNSIYTLLSSGEPLLSACLLRTRLLIPLHSLIDTCPKLPSFLSFGIGSSAQWLTAQPLARHPPTPLTSCSELCSCPGGAHM